MLSQCKQKISTSPSAENRVLDKKPTLSMPVTVTLQLTELCNLRCRMCYYWGETGTYSSATAPESRKVLDLDLIKKLVSELNPGKPIYSLFGGEPLMHPQIEDVIVTIKEAGSYVDTPTNGTLLTENAAMLVRTGFDAVRVSLDGPREINDRQRGKGAFDKAMAGIESLHQEKQKFGGQAPSIEIIYTVTDENCHSIERFFLEDFPLHAIDKLTIQMQNFITEKMGKDYRDLLESGFGITCDRYWRGMIRSPDVFDPVDSAEIARQVQGVQKRLTGLEKHILLLPPTFSRQNLSAYLAADWRKMTDRYTSCPAPWTVLDVTAAGDVAPCHIFYDLTMGSLHQASFSDIWNGDRYRAFRAHMKEHQLMPICHGCCVLYLIGRFA
jgi:radical SAM protein with 4Fe4S-binding SPASM domain